MARTRCASLIIAARIRELIDSGRALRRAAKQAVTVTYFPAVQVNDHFAPPVEGQRSNMIIAAKFLRGCCGQATVGGNNARAHRTDANDFHEFTRRFVAKCAGRGAYAIHDVGVVFGKKKAPPKRGPAGTRVHCGKLVPIEKAPLDGGAEWRKSKEILVSL